MEPLLVGLFVGLFIPILFAAFMIWSIKRAKRKEDEEFEKFINDMNNRKK